ncbi:protein GON7 [Candida albicans P37037]|nr:protein GON7 [Candida albicans P37037]KGU19254.1 protein GON7 [Candida albicans 19F]
MKLTPTAIYIAPDIDSPKHFHLSKNEDHSTNGKTTQISDIVIKAGGEDRDKPSDHKDTPLGNLRAELTTLQDHLNIFLTERMKLEKLKNGGGGGGGGDNNKSNEQDLERRILDEGVEEEEIE